MKPPVPGEIVDVLPGLRWIRFPLPMRIGHVNSYLIEDGDGWAVVDPGYGDDQTISIWRALLSGQLAGQPISKVIVTHTHVDHSGAAGWLCETTGAPLYMSEAEYLVTRLNAADPGRHLRPSFQMHLRGHGVSVDMAAAIGTLLSNQASMGTLPDAFVSLHEGDTVDIGSRRLRVLIAPGHSIAQVLLHCVEEHWMLTADQLLGAFAPLMILPPGEPNGDPYSRLLVSLDEMESCVDSETLALPGHYDPFLDMSQSIATLRRHHRSRCDRVLELCRTEPLSAAEIAQFTFSRDLNPRQMNHAVGEIVPYANWLVRQGSMQWLRPDRTGVRRMTPA